MIFDAALLVNPAFNMYHVLDTLVLWDVLGLPPHLYTLIAQTSRQQSTHHLSAGKSANSRVPTSSPKSKRPVIVHGLADFILIAEGTRIALQNMTWAGMQGFQKPLLNDSFIFDGMGALGRTQSERGLTHVEISLAGHQVPGYSPVGGFSGHGILLGFRDSP
ncbi:hypothetical protein EDB85DRAFT_57979 [Lactarius pseudohatsudake]|nr:hypothetical protein EDB85DRAFT_57979 [Lactarius pseudohatsudake]